MRTRSRFTTGDTADLEVCATRVASYFTRSKVFCKICQSFRPLTLSIAALLIVIVTGKVFSPQYLIWLIPLLAYSGASTRIWWVIWGTISLLTITIYPGYYSLTANMGELPTRAGFMQVISSRNELFIFLTVAYMLDLFNLRQRALLSDAEEDTPVIAVRNY